MSPQRPRVVFFFMNGCPHCERTWPAWDKVKAQLRSSAEVGEKELREMSPGDGVSRFPTFVVYRNGEEVKRVEGARENAKALLKELGVSSRRARGTRRRRGGGKLRKRTLRNYVPF
jgi:thiol-disulfide isomerase/thioredoxin